MFSFHSPPFKFLESVLISRPIPVAPGLRFGSAAALLLGLRVRNPPGTWMSVSCECCTLSRRGLCDGSIAHPENSYRMWCVVVCDLETS